MSVPLAMLAAFELGFKCSEKGMNLEASFNLLEKIYGEPSTEEKMLQAQQHAVKLVEKAMEK